MQKPFPSLSLCIFLSVSLSVCLSLYVSRFASRCVCVALFLMVSLSLCLSVFCISVSGYMWLCLCSVLPSSSLDISVPPSLCLSLCFTVLSVFFFISVSLFVI